MRNGIEINTRYRISSKAIWYMGVKSYVGRVHYYEPWKKEKSRALYKRALFSESTCIYRKYAKDALYDAHLLGRDSTLRDMPDNMNLNEINN